MIMQGLQYDGQFNIAVGLSAESKIWKNTKIKWSDFLDRIAEERKTSETLKQYLAASKAEQGKIKDVGGYVGGYLTGGRRKKENVLNRQLLTLDIDFAHIDFWWDFTMLFTCAAAIHSTHKHCQDKPRYRLIIPLSREVSAEEYMAISRRVAGDMNIDLFDQSTFETQRLMFWPSNPCDIEYYFEYQDGPWLDADSVLCRYTNWQDTSEWPTVSSHNDDIKLAIKKQEDPESKGGIIGVFCRTYTIQDAIEEFLKDEYEHVDGDRYTYTKGSTAAGMIVYDDKFAFSHHGTDPAGNRLCNAFDLVRIHKFGHLDNGKEKNESDKKSFKAMEEFAAKDPKTKKHIAEEKFANAKFEFADTLDNDDFDEDEYDDSWVEELDANTKGEYNNSANNINLIIQHDKMLRNAFKLNVFDNKRYVVKSLPWRKIEEAEPFRDVDYSGLRNYIECVYGITASQKVDDSLALEFEKKSYHPIKEYIKSLKWDGNNRIERLLVDYFGADNNDYTRAAIKKSLCGAVARVFHPGIKFDLVLTLIGDQGTFKSTFVKKLGKQWFSDTFLTVQGKEAFEQIQGAWIIEMAELSGLKKAEVETIKQFITKAEDMYRPAYGRVVETYKRQCVFFGTTNNKDFLRDATGNRRFMPIDVRPDFITKSVVDDLDEKEVDQVWAEAYKLWISGEPLYLTGNEEKIAKIEQHKHTEADERKGIIEEYLSRLLPKDWYKKDLQDRRRYLDDPLSIKGTIERQYVCVAEVWCECLGKDKNEMSRYNTRELNEIMKSLSDWESVTSTKNFTIYGKQKYYQRKDSLM